MLPPGRKCSDRMIGSSADRIKEFEGVGIADLTAR
jgi:hypothetical protein